MDSVLTNWNRAMKQISKLYWITNRNGKKRNKVIISCLGLHKNEIDKTGKHTYTQRNNQKYCWK